MSSLYGPLWSSMILYGLRPGALLSLRLGRKERHRVSQSGSARDAAPVRRSYVWWADLPAGILALTFSFGGAVGSARQLCSVNPSPLPILALAAAIPLGLVAIVLPLSALDLDQRFGGRQRRFSAH